MAKFILPYNISSTPQSLRDSPGGALGTVFPRPLASLRSDRFVLHLYPFIKIKGFCVVLQYESCDCGCRGGGVFLRH